MVNKPKESLVCLAISHLAVFINHSSDYYKIRDEVHSAASFSSGRVNEIADPEQVLGHTFLQIAI